MHTLSYWRQSGRGPKTIKAGNRTLYRREDVERWLADADGRIGPSRAGATSWFTKAVEAAERIDRVHTAPWELASTYALLAIAEAVLPHPTPATRPPMRTDLGTNASCLPLPTSPQ